MWTVLITSPQRIIRLKASVFAAFCFCCSLLQPDGDFPGWRLAFRLVHLVFGQLAEGANLLKS